MWTSEKPTEDTSFKPTLEICYKGSTTNIKGYFILENGELNRGFSRETIPEVKLFLHF